MKNYMLTVRFPFEALDVLEARQLAQGLMKDLQLSEIEKKMVKLQEMRRNKAPEGISL